VGVFGMTPETSVSFNPLTVASPIFISRESQLKRLLTHLSVLKTTPRNRCVLVYGPAGTGKSSLVLKFCESFKSTTTPLVVFRFNGGNQTRDVAGMLDLIAGGVESDWPELEPYVAAFCNYRGSSELDAEKLYQEFIGKLDEYFFQTEQRDTHPELGELQVLFLVEDVDLFESQEIDILAQLQKKLKQDPHYSAHYHFLFSGAEKSNCRDRIQQIFAGEADIEDIPVPPFTQPETEILLKQYGVDANNISEIQQETGGLPSKLVEYCLHYKPADATETQKMHIAEDILKSLGREQEEWLKISALLVQCDEESLGLFLSEDQRTRAIKWLRIGYLDCIEIQNGGIQIREKERESLIAYQKRENPGKLSKRLMRVQHLESVKRVVPKLEHRKLLSLLAEFDFFDRGVLIHVFGEKTAELLLNLVDSKTVFFSVFESNIRLSQNAKIMMRLYNQLFPVKELAVIRAKVKAYWAKRMQDMQSDIAEAEERVAGNETIREDVKNGIAQLDNQIAQMGQQLAQADRDRKSMIVQLRRSHMSYLSIILQLLGIIMLYVAVLYREDFMIELLIVAGALITLGFIISFRRQGTLKVSHLKVIKQSQKRKKMVEDLERLKSEKLQLATRRDQSMTYVQQSRDRIATTQQLLKQPYMKF